MILQGTSYNEEEADKNRPQKRDRLFHFKDLSAGKTTKGGLDFEQKKKKQQSLAFRQMTVKYISEIISLEMIICLWR